MRDNLGTFYHAAPALLLRVGDQEKLEKLVRSGTAPSGLAARARVVLLAAEGLANYEIAVRETEPPILSDAACSPARPLLRFPEGGRRCAPKTAGLGAAFHTEFPSSPET